MSDDDYGDGFASGSDNGSHFDGDDDMDTIEPGSEDDAAYVLLALLAWA